MSKILKEADSAGRKAIPLVRGFLDYFPDACIYVAKVSAFGNVKHNPGEPLYHNREKSGDEADGIMRHLIERGGDDAESGLPASAHLAWRALSLLQKELEERGLATAPRGAKWPTRDAAQAAQGAQGTFPRSLDDLVPGAMLQTPDIVALCQCETCQLFRKRNAILGDMLECDESPNYAPRESGDEFGL